MTGTIQGGLEFVTAGYILTWVVLSGYAISLFLRKRNLKND